MVKIGAFRQIRKKTVVLAVAVLTAVFCAASPLAALADAAPTSPLSTTHNVGKASVTPMIDSNLNAGSSSSSTTTANYTGYKVSTAPTIDGKLTDACWASGNFSEYTDMSDSTPTEPLEETFKYCWDTNNLYIGFTTLDNNLFFNPTKVFAGEDGANADALAPFQYDAMELYFSPTNSTADGYLPTDRQLIFTYQSDGICAVRVGGDGDSTQKTDYAAGLYNDVVARCSTMTGGWQAEVQIPWKDLGVTAPASGSTYSVGIATDNNSEDGSQAFAFADGNACWNSFSNADTLTLSDTITDPATGLEFDRSTGFVTGYTGSSTTVTVPRTIDGVAVVGIGAFAFSNGNYDTVVTGASAHTVGTRASVLSDENYGPEDDSNNVEITSVILPDGIKYIDDSAFQGCDKLASINLPDSIVSIGRYAFENTALTSVLLPKNLTYISDCEFCDCSSLTNVTIPNNIISIGEYAFSSTGLSSVSLPDGIRNIAEGAFDNCSQLTSINLPDSIINIGDNAFMSTALTSITLPKNLTEISEGMLSYCASLKSVNIPNGVTKIGEWAFSGCKLLTEINIPIGIISIKDGAFDECDALTSINADKNSPYFSTQDGILFNKTETTLIVCPGGKTGDYEIPNSVKTIEQLAFAGCDYLSSITIPDGVLKIDSNTFDDCYGLLKVTIPESVIFIGDYNFSDTTIYGYTGSYAQEYAKENDCGFMSIDNIPVHSSVAAGSTAALSHEFDTTGASWKSSDSSVVSVQSQTTDTSNPSKTIYNATIQGVKPGTATVALVDGSGNTVYSHIVTVSPTDPLYVSLTGAKFIGTVSDGSADSRYPTPVTVELPSTATSLKASDILASNNDAVALYSSADYSSAGLVGDGGAALSGNTTTLYLTATNGLNGTVKYYKLTVDLVGSSSYKLTAPAVFTKTGTNYTAAVTIDRAQAEKLSDPKLYVVYTIANNGKQFQTYQCIDISSSDTTTTKDIVVGAGFVKATTFLVDGTVDWSQGFPSMKSNVLTIAMPS